MPQQLLEFDAATHHLTIAGGSRKDTRALAALAAIVALPDAAWPLTGRGIEGALADGDFGRDVVRDAIKVGVRRRDLREWPSKRQGGGKFYQPSDMIDFTGSEPVQDERRVGVS